jgi:hypothetical protein
MSNETRDAREKVASSAQGACHFIWPPLFTEPLKLGKRTNGVGVNFSSNRRKTSMYIQTSEGLGRITTARNGDERVKWSLGEPPPTPQACDNRFIPERTAVRALTARRVACTQHNAFGVISRAVARALEMLDKTISELVNARNAVCAGATPAPPLPPILRAITSDWLRNRLGVCIDDIRVWTTGTFVNRSVAEVIRRLVRVRNLIGSNRLRYSCSSPRCEPDDWAFVIVRDAADNCLPGTPQMLIRLCRAFWEPARGVDPAVHAEFQAQTIIHEASHLTHCNPEVRTGHTIGVAECLAQFVAATNGSPLDPDFERSCATTNRCASAAATRRPGVAGLGFAGPGSNRITRTIFRPQNAIRLKGRPAVRR